MAQSLLTEILAAEQRAEALIAQAQSEAREIVKAVEEANAALTRQAVQDMHEAAQKRLSDARAATQDEIKALELRRSAEREALKRTAQQRVSQAGAAVFEKVVNHGDR